MAPRSDDEEEFHDGDEGGDNDNVDLEEEQENQQQDEAAEGEENRAKKDKVGLMQNSGLTESERRQIRKNQRELLKEMEDHDELDLEIARGRNNELFKSVRFTREAVLDGDNLILIANKAKKQTDRMIQVRLIFLSNL